MAIDTRQKRASASNLLMPYMHGAQSDTNGVSDAERWAVTWIYSGISLETPSATLMPLRNLVIDIDQDLGMTLIPTGNTFGITAMTTIPSSTPPGDKGLVCHINNGIVTIYVWDTGTNTWLKHGAANASAILETEMFAFMMGNG